MTDQKNIPDFFIVGAPKCGTTALDFHLSLHPEVFMATKELHYFGADIGMIQEDLSHEEYLNCFSESKTEHIKGESSVWYLYSEEAPKEILALNPAAKIIVMLRKPSEMIPSLHGQYLYNGIEKLKPFEDAFQFDLQRTSDYPCALFKERPKYLDAALYSKHVKRYIDTFGSSNVLIVLHENLSTDFDAQYQRVLEFINVNDTSFAPTAAQINKRKEVRNVKLHQMSKTPPDGLKKAFRTLVPSKKLRHAIMKWVEDKNVQDDATDGASEMIKQEIINLTKEDTLALGQLLNIKLDHWNS